MASLLLSIAGWPYHNVMLSSAAASAQTPTTQIEVKMEPGTPRLSACSNTQNGSGSNSSGAESAHSDSQPNAETRFVFPQAVPISPGLIPNGAFFNQNNNISAPITPSLLTPGGNFAESYLKTQNMYSPFTLAPGNIQQAMPRTPTLPPPSPHSLAAFQLNPQAYPNQTAIINSPYKGPNLVEDMARFGNFSPLIMSPAPAFPSPKSTTQCGIFFPSTATMISNGESKLIETVAVQQQHHMTTPTQHSGPPSAEGPLPSGEEVKNEVCGFDQCFVTV